MNSQSSPNSSPTLHFHPLPNGITLHAAHWGDPAKPLMLFIHGFPEFWFAWRNIAPTFADDYYCVAPDLRGFNLSSMPSDISEYKAHKVAQDIYLLAQSLGKQSAIVVSHDWGGAVAWSMAIAQTNGAAPALMRAHISINSPHPYTFWRELSNNPAQQAASAYMLWLCEPFAAEALSKDKFAKVKSFMLGMTTQQEWFTEAVAQEYEACWARGLDGGLNYYRATPLLPPSEKHAGVSRHADARSWEPKLAELGVNNISTLVLWGETDSALLPSLIDGLDELVTPLKVQHNAQASHWICHEQPQWVIEAIHTFITNAHYTLLR